MPHVPVLTITPPDGRIPLVFNWGVSSFFGWGVYGMNLMLALAADPDFIPMTAAEFDSSELVLDPLRQARIASAADGSARLWRSLAAVRGSDVEADAPVLVGLGNQLAPVAAVHQKFLVGRPTIGVVFMEHTTLNRDARARAEQLALIVAGSSWNESVLRGNGLSAVAKVLQGVDTSLYHPAPKAGLFPGRFVIFSGGKLEQRKGQDLVLAAFRIFRQRHPEALLLTAWNSPWTQTVQTASARPDITQPVLGPGGPVDVIAWAEANDIPANAIVSAGMTPNIAMPHVVREADVALFPNRCEGGTNLVAMECMACGIPTILSANTGHLDLLRFPDAALPLQRQTPNGTEGWHDSDVEEIVAGLETVWSDRAAAATMGACGAAAMATLSWPRQVDQLIRAIEPVLP